MATSSFLKIGQFLKSNLIRNQLVLHGTRKCSDQSSEKRQEKIRVTIITRKYDALTLQGFVGESLLDTANRYADLDDFGVCNGTCACGTCIVIMYPEDYKKVLKPVTEEEQDMFDMKEEDSPHARLGCQITLTKEMDGMTVEMTKKITSTPTLGIV